MNSLLLLKEKNPRIYLFLLSVLSGVLLWAAWPMGKLFPLVFVGFVPLLFIEDYISNHYPKSGRKVFLYAYVAFLIWNVFTTWWIYYASPGGAVAAIVLNALLMTVPFLAFHHTKKRTKSSLAYLSFIIYWLAFEYVHLTWEFTWPWLTLGNVFALFPEVVQWYEYCGVLGGSLWVLFLNLSIYKSINDFAVQKWRVIVKPAFFIVVPIVISLSMAFDMKAPADIEKIEVVVVQPNIDPYTEKFPSDVRNDETNTSTFIPYEKQLEILIEESEKIITPQTKYLLWPETAFPKGYWEHELESYVMIKKIRDFTARYKGLTLITGADTYGLYPDEKSASSSARYAKGIGFYDVFNTALQIDDSGKMTSYHKSKLVPGVERMPYPGVFTFLEYFAIDLGGVVGSLGIQSERTTFLNTQKIGVAPAICYESVFGEFVGEYVKNGAHFIGIITNDGWWEDTPGHKQHFHYARLRAVEHRREIARSANTGISGFINAKGEIVQTLDWRKKGALIGEVKLNERMTIYSQHGDYLGRLSGFIAIALALSIIVKRKITVHAA